MSEVQAVAFNKNIWTSAMARKWLKLNKMKPIKRARIEGEWLRYRLRDPQKYKRFITKKTREDLNLIIGFQ